MRLSLNNLSKYKFVYYYFCCTTLWGRLMRTFDKNMLLLKNPQYLPDHYETLTQ